MAQQQPTATTVPQDGASRIIRKLDSIEKKLTLLLWFIALPFIVAIVMFVLSLVSTVTYYD